MADSRQNLAARLNPLFESLPVARLLAAVCFALLMAGATHATSYTWTGQAPSGQTTDWSNSQNWTPNGVPGPMDNATINKPSPHPILTTGVKITNLTLSNGGTIEGGSVEVTGLLTMAGGSFVSSHVTAGGGMMISTQGSNEASLKGAKLIHTGSGGTAARLTSGTLKLEQNGTENAEFSNGGEFLIGGGAKIQRSTSATDGSKFINDETFRSDPNHIGDNLGTVIAVKGKTFFENNGLVDIEAGILTFDADVLNEGEFKTNTSPTADATIKIAPGKTLELGLDASLTGPGLIEVNGNCNVSQKASAVRLKLKSIAGFDPAKLSFETTGELTVSNTFELQGGTIAGTAIAIQGLVVLNAFNISGANVIENVTVRNNGTANFPSGSEITGNGAVFKNGGTVNLTGGLFNQIAPVTLTFINEATGVINYSGGVTIFACNLGNIGKVEVQQGTLTFAGNVSSSGTFTAADNTKIEFSSTAPFNTEFLSGTRLEGAGLFRAIGNIAVKAEVPVTRFEFNGSSKTMSGSPGGRLLVSTLFDWKAGNLSCSPAGQVGLLAIGSGATLNISDGTSKTNNGCVIDNAGTVNVTTTSRFIMDNGAVLNNASSGFVNFSSATNQGVFNENGPTPTFNNAGTVNWGGGSTSPTFSFPFYNQSGGTTNVAPGITLDLYSGSSFNDAFNLGNNGQVRSNNNKPIELKTGRMTTGAFGTIVSPGGFDNTQFFIDIDGNEPGLLNLNGPYKAGDGKFEFDFRGTGAGTQYDQVNVSGNATLGGTVDIDLQNGFVPQAGNTFQPVTYGSHTGTFTRINFLNPLPNDRRLVARYENTSLNLVTSLINNALNGPVINSAVTDAGGTTIQGTFTASPNSGYLISIFTNPTASVSNCDNASQSLVGSITITTNGTGSVNFSVNLPAPLLVGQFVTAIATDNANVSSKLSACVQVTAGGNTVQFTATNQSAGEADGSVTVAVTRTGANSAGASVDYATSDGTASERSDYSATIGKLIFAAGEATKSVKVLLADDAYVEGAETFTVTLSNPMGGLVLGAQRTATVTINDNDASPGPNPLDNAQFFVRQHYADFLNREPDPAGLVFWTNQMTNCSNPPPADLTVCRINVSAAFFLSIEFQQTGYLVYRTYGAAFGTRRVGATVPLTLLEFLPDTQQIGAGIVVNSPGWEQQFEANKVAYFNDFVSRAAFTSAYPQTLSAAQFVDALNANAGGALTQAERDQLVADLSGGGKTRAQVLRLVAENSVFTAAERNRAFVLMEYFGYLKRNPNDSPEANRDFAGYNFWLGKLNQFGGNFVQAEMVKAFITSLEYRGRFGPQ